MKTFRSSFLALLCVLPHFHIEFYFSIFVSFLPFAYTMPLCTHDLHTTHTHTYKVSQSGREENSSSSSRIKLRKSTLTIYIEWFKLSFMMSIKAWDEIKRTKREKNINTYQFFADTRFFLSYTACCCCSFSIRNQNIYQQRNENGMDRWLRIKIYSL